MWRQSRHSSAPRRRLASSRRRAPPISRVNLDRDGTGIGATGNVATLQLASAGSPIMTSGVSGKIAAIGELVLQRGMTIPLTLVNGVDSTLGGMIVAQVSEDVYDVVHRAVVIPRGSKAIGEYSNATTQAQARLYCTIDTIQLPDHASIHVDNLPCVDTNGQAGIPARVDTHRGRAMGDVAMMSVLAAGAQFAQPQATIFQAPSVGSVIAGSVGSQIANLGTQELSRSLALGPTLHVDEGTKFAAMIKTDIAAQPYRN
jgi:type IV secretory pathway VirB10-like protein